ncbi:MAG: alanine racemase [Clostridiales bacterium]|nr:alanine racemase [Clostridiales bacterium]
MNIWAVPRPAWAEIDLAHISHNMRQIRGQVGKQTKIMAVVKANGYGLGAEQIARTVLKSGADRLGVATLGEGACLRMAGITAPVMVLGYVPPSQCELAIRHNIVQSVYSYDIAAQISAIATRQNRQAVIHIKIDSGMGRIGFLPDPDSLKQIRNICRLPGIYVEGIYSHLATADCADKSYALHQLAVFEQFLTSLGQAGLEFPLKHIANSGAILDLPQSYYDMVRPGIMVYGYYPSEEVNHNLKLLPALTVKAQISCLKVLPANSPVSYGCHWQSEQESLIASLPLGYGDGYNRALSGRGQVLIGGKRALVVGAVCMDQMMADITGMENISIGDEVVIIGKQGKEEIIVEEIANKINTINFEILCNLSERLPRIYLNQ